MALTERTEQFCVIDSALTSADSGGGVLKPHRFGLQSRDNCRVAVSSQAGYFQGSDADASESALRVVNLAP